MVLLQYCSGIMMMVIILVHWDMLHWVRIHKFELDLKRSQPFQFNTKEVNNQTKNCTGFSGKVLHFYLNTIVKWMVIGASIVVVEIKAEAQHTYLRSKVRSLMFREEIFVKLGSLLALSIISRRHISIYLSLQFSMRS